MPNKMNVLSEPGLGYRVAKQTEHQDMAERSIALAVGVGALLAAAGRAAAAGAAGSNPGYHSPSEDDDYVEAHNYRRRLPRM